ncbi:hypothetical protein GKC56_03205 [Neisseriaceae bacterium PsAf]|nr:hypothetical protein [Neisseriaceae bacterium PsAf]MCV2502486.1 hypothetical protein [Neisseriaceae bacterium]
MSSEGKSNFIWLILIMILVYTCTNLGSQNNKRSNNHSYHYTNDYEDYDDYDGRVHDTRSYEHEHGGGRGRR